jgi:hypothetical protein
LLSRVGVRDVSKRDEIVAVPRCGEVGHGRLGCVEVRRSVGG